jgi:hypothetical protein
MVLRCANHAKGLHTLREQNTEFLNVLLVGVYALNLVEMVS